MEYIIKPTVEYEKLVKFFVENQLEFDGDEEVDTDIINCYEANNEEGELVGGAVLAKREGRFIVDGIAVDSSQRGSGLGKKMLDILIDDVKKLGGDSLYLVARAPGFFKKSGFSTVNPDEAPNFFECKYCPQYGVSCHPEIMKLYPLN